MSDNLNWIFIWWICFMAACFIGLFGRDIARWCRQITQAQQTIRRTRRIKDNLSPVEAAVLLGHNENQVIKMILFMLIKKRVIKPAYHGSLKLERTGSRLKLKYYERDAMRIIRRDGTINTEMIGMIHRKIRANVNRKMQEYNIDATKNFYRNRIEQRLEMVERSLILNLQEG